MRCQNWLCEKRANGHVRAGKQYCSADCAQQDSSETSKSTESEATEKSISRERSEISAGSSGPENSIGYERTSRPNETTKRREIDTGQTSKSTEPSLPPTQEEDEFSTPERSEPRTVSASVATTQPGKSGVLIPNYDEDLSHSRNMVDESIQSMHELIISVRENIKQKNKGSQHPHVDPQQVNSAVNCAREMANLLKLKLQLAKEMRAK